MIIFLHYSLLVSQLDQLSAVRALLFRQILPGLNPLLRSLKEIAERRGKTIPQVFGLNNFLILNYAHQDTTSCICSCYKFCEDVKGIQLAGCDKLVHLQRYHTHSWS